MKTNPNTSFTIGEVQLSYHKTTSFPLDKISSSEDVFCMFRKILPTEQINHREYFYVLYLNSANQVLGYHQVSVGGVNGTLADVRIILQGALLSNASAMILIHNHPSGNLLPSISDKAFTQRIKVAGDTMEVKVLDHLIISDSGYYSFADKGTL